MVRRRHEGPAHRLGVGFPPERIHFHGNNKSEEELTEALDYGIARVIVDNFHEIYLLNAIEARRGARLPNRSLVFFVIILSLALLSFSAIRVVYHPENPAPAVDAGGEQQP